MEWLVRERTHELAEANRKLELLSREDGLLGIGNRRAMEERLLEAQEVGLRYERPYSIALYDLDAFKAYNDQYGPLAGDDALKWVASHLAERLRRADRLYRYGGEEILMVLPETPVSGAHALAERMRASVEQLGIPHSGSAFGVVTLSCGVAGVKGGPDCRDGWRALVQQADEALYRAKQAGRNRVCGPD